MAMDRLGRRLLGSRRSAATCSSMQAGSGAVARDPDGDGSFRVNGGLKAARELLLHLNRLGVPTAVDFADTVTPQFFADLVSCASVLADSRKFGAILHSRLRRPALPCRRSPRSPRRCASLSPASRCPSACVRPSTTPPPPSARTRSRRRPTTSSASPGRRRLRNRALDGQPGRPPPPLGDAAARHRRRRRGGRRHGARRLGVRSCASPCCGRCGRVGGRWRPTRRRRATARWSTRPRRRWRRATRGSSVCG